MTTIIFIMCIFIAVAFSLLIACKLCYKNDIHWLLIGAWALSITGLITRFAGIW